MIVKICNLMIKQVLSKSSTDVLVPNVEMLNTMDMKKVTFLTLVTISLFMTSVSFASNVKEFEIDGVKLGMSKEEAFEALDSIYGKAKGYVRVDNVTFFGYDNGSEAITIFMGAFLGDYKAKNVMSIVKKVSGDDYDKVKTIEQINSNYGMPDQSLEFDDDYSARWCDVDNEIVRCKDRSYLMFLEASSTQAQLTISDLSEYYK